MTKIYTFDSAKGKNIEAGELESKSSFVTHRKKNHFMGIYQGYGIQKDVIEQLEDKCVITIKTHKSENYTSEVSKWKKDAVLANYGHGYQYFLPVADMLLK